MENNRNDYDDELRKQIDRCLRKTSEIRKRLKENRSKFPKCETYLSALDAIETIVSGPKATKNKCDKLEDKLNEYHRMISEARERENLQYSRSPDSTATHDFANVTSESGRYVHDRRIRDNSSDYHPDSTTMNEGPYGSLNRRNESHDANNVVSSSSSRRYSPVHVPDDTFPSLYSRRRDNSIESERSVSETDDPVRLIMDTVKNRLDHSVLNQSSHSNYGMSSTEEIERYEEKLMVQPENSSTPEKSNTANFNASASTLSASNLNTEATIASASNLNAESSIQDSPDLNVSPNKNVDSQQKKDRPLSVREKIAQGFGTLHKVGESSKIRPSLKQLKSDRNLSSSPSSSSSTSSKDQDDYRSRKSSDYHRHSERYSRSPRSPGPYSRRDSPRGYRSPKDSQDDYHTSNRRRSRSRSRERRRADYSDISSNNRILSKISLKDDPQSTSFRSFVNNVGSGRCPSNERKDNENRKKDDKNDDSKPSFKVLKKSSMRFKVNTNLPASKVDSDAENNTAKVEAETTEATKTEAAPTLAAAPTVAAPSTVAAPPTAAHPTTVAAPPTAAYPTTVAAPLTAAYPITVAAPLTAAYPPPEATLPSSPVCTPSPRYSSPAYSDPTSSPRIQPLLDVRLPETYFNDQQEGFSRPYKADPRLKQTFPQNTDPRFGRQPFQKPLIPKDPRTTRVPPPSIPVIRKDIMGFHTRIGIPPPEAGFSSIPRTPEDVFSRTPEASFSTIHRTGEVGFLNVPKTPETGIPNDRRMPSSSFPAVNREIDDSFRSRVGITPSESSVFNIARTASTPSTTPNISRENASQLPSFQNQPKPSNFIPPVTKETDTNQPSSSQGKPHPAKQNRFQSRYQVINNVTRNNLKQLANHKNNMNGNIYNKPKQNNYSRTPASHIEVKEQRKNSNEFQSPLEGIFQTSEAPKTGRGYGQQRPKKNAQPPTFNKKFTIPKIRKPSAEADKVTENPSSTKGTMKKSELSNADEDWSECSGNSEVETPTKNSTSSSEKTKKIFHDDDDWDAAISESDSANDAVTASPQASFPSNDTPSLSSSNTPKASLPSNNTLPTSSSNAPKASLPSSSTSKAPLVPSNDTVSNVDEINRKTVEPAQVDITASIIDEEECWDPVDSPPIEHISETNTSKDTAEIPPPKDPIRIEIVDGDIPGQDYVEDLTHEKSGDEIIELDDNDDADKSDSSRSVQSAGNDSPADHTAPQVHEVCSSETDYLDDTTSKQDHLKSAESDSQRVQKQFPEQGDTHATTTPDFPTRDSTQSEHNERAGAGSRRSSDTVGQDAPSSQAEKSETSNDEILKTKVVDYLQSLSNPPKISEDEAQQSFGLFMLTLVTKLTPEQFTELQAVIAKHRNGNQNEPKETTPAVEDNVPEQPTVEEETPPARGFRGRRKTKKNAPKTMVKPKPPVQPKKTSNQNTVRRRFTELDRLQADIKKMQHTKNNVLDIGETRRCRFQTLQKLDSKASRRANEGWMSSESEFDSTTKSGTRRKRSKADLGSDSDSIPLNKRNKSKALISSDSSSDAGSESEDTSPKKSQRHTFEDIRKYKACPRYKKIEHFGVTNYEEFEETEGRKDLEYMKKKHCPKEILLILPKYPTSCDNDADCLCHGKKQVVKDNSVIDEAVESIVTKFEEQRAATLSKNIVRAPRKRKAQPGKTSKLRMKMSKSGHFPSWQVVNQVKNQKSANQKEKANDPSDSATLPPTSPSPVSTATKSDNDSSTVSQGKQSLESTVTEDDANDDFKDLPKYNAFKNSDLTTIKLATIGVRMSDSALVYVCKTNGCDYESVDIAMFALHLTFLHKDWKIKAGCKLCGYIRKFLNLKSAFRHLLQEHLDVNPDLNQIAVTPNIQIKEEPLDETPSQDVVLDEEGTHEDHAPTENVASTFQPVPVAVVPPFRLMSAPTPPPRVPSPEKVPASPPISSASKNPPKIRVRRFSGDLLSGPDALSDSQRSTPEIGNVLEQVANSPLETVVFGPLTEKVPNLPSTNADTVVTTLLPNAGSSSSTTNNTVTSTNTQQIQNMDNALPNAATELDLISNNFTEAELNLIQFYKCSEPTCGFATNHKKEFLNHLHNIHRCGVKIGVKRSRKFDPDCLLCKYCSKKFDTPEMLVIHMEKYEICKFQCAYCEFRASRPVFVLWHLNLSHVGRTTKILVSSLDDNKIDVANSSVEKDLKEVVIPLNCVHCNNFRSISFDEYKHHWKKNHSQTDSWECYICKTPYLSVDRGLNHLKLHGYGEYQCVYCIHGAATEDVIKTHLMREHYTLYPKVVKRILAKDPETAHRFDDYVEILDLDKPFDKLKQYFLVINQNKASAITLHADTPDGIVSATGIYVLNKNKEYVLNVLNLEATEKHREMRDASSSRKGSNETLTGKRNDGILLPANVISETSDNAGDSNNDDVIAVCSSDDDDSSDRLVINEDAQAAASKTAIAKSMDSSGLCGTDLYKCGFIGCTAAFESFHPFKDHLSTCDNARNRSSPKCPHCNRTFQKNAAFLTHIGLHGIPRYICSLCDNRFATPKKAEDHVKQHHRVNSFKVIPANPLKNNSHEDLYVVVPNSEKGGGKGKQFKKVSDSKNLPSTSAATTAESKEAAVDFPAKQITTVYSLRDVERYLPMQLFSEPVTCGICSTYDSKVRQNIILHLKCHSTGLGPVKDITNPVPCTDKSELMFNKMTNHAAFSSKAEDKKIKCLIEKVEAYSGDKNEIIPAFVPKTLRYSCGAPDCVYRSTDAIRLKIHWETLHSDLNFNCPHCNVFIPVEKIHTHLRYHDGRLYKCYYCTKLHYQRQGIENHQIENHPESPSQVQVIRDLTPEEIEEICRETRYQHDVSQNRNTVAYPKSNLWKCNLCKCCPMISEQLIKAHCLTCHRVDKQYKCCLCSFTDDDKNEVNKHMTEKHESISQVVVTVYNEITENEENLQSSDASSPNKSRRDSQSSNQADEQQNMARNSDRNAADESNSSRNEFEDLSNPEMNDLLILPLSNNRYKCPFCEEYNTPDKQSMREHLYQEKKYERYVCYDCGTHSVTEDEIIKHAEANHGLNINVGKFSEDEVIEKQVEQILDYQQNRFTQVNNEGSIEISSEEEEETSARANVSSGVKLPLVNSATSEFRCTQCPKVCSNSAGLKNHINYVHGKKNAKKGKALMTVTTKPAARISPVMGSTTIVPNINGVYPCSYCQKEFTSSTIAKHLCVCPNYTKSNDTSPTKLGEFRVLANDRKLACSYCGKRCNPASLDDHIILCKFQQMSRSLPRKSCDFCALEMDESSLKKHIKYKHQPMECLHCDKILTGSEGLENHVQESLINISGSNRACVAQEKDVVIMCPYCPTGLIGQSYDKYLYISDHISKKHNPVEITKKVGVKIRNTVRELMDSEIALMQSKYNQEQQALNSMTLPTDAKKKRNVAIKSTSRAPPTSVLRVSSDTIATDESFRPCVIPKINIIYKNSK
ncbi:uncharacterized protein LOC135836014 isoform X3 [Planococcus citri]|uniref:uncharacterized protein LOC135836014 isoform X3 n=1 Tax=Planococcus citri TaxID=170843 RepID=UPI0031F81146